MTRRGCPRTAGRPRDTLVIMARRPRFGSGKRRLAASAGELAAWRFQRLALAALLRRLKRDPRWRLELAVTPDGAAAGSARWCQQVPRRPQGNGDLGQRMLAQLGRNQRHPGAVLVIGADVPGIDRPALARAFRLLRRHDWVLGPASDGGFWAIGARRRPWRVPDLHGVAWGSDRVLKQTRTRLAGSLALLELRSDVDTAAALAAWSALQH